MLVLTCHPSALVLCAHKNDLFSHGHKIHVPILAATFLHRKYTLISHNIRTLTGKVYSIDYLITMAYFKGWYILGSK